MSRKEDVQFLALLVHRGHVERARAGALLASLQNGAELDTLLSTELAWPPERIAKLRRTNAGETPEIPGYELLGKLGSGGTSDVFRAREKKTGQFFALKVLNEASTKSPATLAAFVREARLLKDLDHQGVVRCHGVLAFEAEIKRYFTKLECLEGSTLLELLDQGTRFPEESLLRIVESVAEALGYLASQGVIHRDVKPGNIMLTQDGRVVLIDLGFAAYGGERTKEGIATGTKEYVAPEQAQGGGTADLRSDVYSLGCTLFHLAVGRLPFAATDDQELLRQHVTASLSSPEIKSRGISPHLHYLIERMMSKDPEHRFQSWEELEAEIRATSQGIEKLKGVGTPLEKSDKRPPPRRRRF